MTLTPLQRLLSLLVPVRVLKTDSSLHSSLEIYRYRNRWQLATEDAYYSDGAQYAPLRKAFQALRKGVFHWESVVVLGAGLGSAVVILDKQYRRRPAFTLVDIDEQILLVAGEVLAADGHAGHVELICDDASHYVQIEERRFDCVVVDLFRGRVVPDFALTAFFLEQCLRRIIPGGSFVMNYIINDEAQWEELQQLLAQYLPGSRVLAHGINRIILFTLPQP